MLTSAQRSRLRAGDSPRIAYELDEECSFEVGQRIPITDSVWIEISSVKVHRKSKQRVVSYVLHHHSATYMKAGGGTTRNPLKAIQEPSGAAEDVFIPPEYQEALAAEGRLKTLVSGAERRREGWRSSAF